MKKKLIPLILTTIICIMALFSCQIPGMGTGTGTGNGTGDGTIEANIKTIIHADESLDLMELRTALGKIMGAGVRVADDTNASDGAELVIGDTNRPITAAAKSALEKELAKTDDYDMGYIIYSDGESIALYWSRKDMADIAIPKLMSEYLSGSKLEIKKGILYTEFYRKDVFERDKAWALIEANSTPDVLAALKELYAFFDGSMLAGWCANLYDPEIGGFYYSISARDNPGYYPDMESTSQLISTMVTNGAFSNRNTAFPEEIKAKIVNFIKNNQSTTDGYFYHPQWPQDKALLATDRYGRDQGWAIGLINSCTLDTDGVGVQEKQYPLYCNTARNTKCEKHEGTDEKCIFPITDAQAITAAAASDNQNLTDVICVSTSSAVAKVKTAYENVIAAATVSSHPDYSSREAFKTWLYAYNNPEQIKVNSGKAHNLSAICTEIAAHGMLDILIEQLNTVQAELFEEQLANGEEPTGLWQRNIDYRAVWGLLKYMSIYNNGAGYPIDTKYLPYIAKTCVKVTSLPADDLNFYMNDLYNQWTGLTGLLSNVRKHNKGSEYLIYDVIRENSAPLVSNSLAKIESFKISDGSFGYQPGGYSLTKIYGVPISLGLHEGDVNAVALVTGMYKAIFECLGYTAVPIFTEADGKAFIETISNCEPIVKNEIEMGTIDFDDGMANVSFSAGSGNASATIVEDPKDSSNNVLSFNSPALASGSGATLTCKPVIIGSGCIIFETKMYVEASDSNNYLLQMTLADKMYMLSLHRSGNEVVLKETTTASSGAVSANIGKAKIGEWFSFRIEYYMPEEDGASPNIKIWFNEEFVRNSQLYYDSHLGSLPRTNFNAMEIYSMRGAGTYVYIDDVYCSVETKEFDPDETEFWDARD